MLNKTQDDIKIVIIGNVGSGKTTCINAISEIPAIFSEAKATENDALHRKLTTTVGFDYGQLYVNNKKIHIYGSPGQRRFDFIAPILCKGCAGKIIMIDNGHKDPLKELDYFLQHHREFLQEHPGIIAVTHYDDNETNTHLVEYHEYIIHHGFRCPVMRLDARDSQQVSNVIKKLVAIIVERGSPTH